MPTINYIIEGHLSKTNLVLNLDVFKHINKLTRKDFLLLIEAYRRQHLMGKPVKPLSVAWVGLGKPTAYKSKFFKPLNKEVPRANNWYLLTETGIEIFKKLEAEFPAPTDFKIKNEMNEFFFDYWVR